jgi:hypothetical protein
MLDVHPSPAAAHTWKDFCMRLGTISVGLEQSVEAVHRLDERMMGARPQDNSAAAPSK